MGRKLGTSKPLVKVAPRADLINHLAQRIAALLGEKNANIAEMGMTSIVVLQIMLQYGLENEMSIPSSLEVETPEGYRFSYQIEQIDPNEVPVSHSGLVGALN